MSKILEQLGILLKREVDKIPRPCGIFLSGGLDSGLLAAFSEPDFAITCNFPEGEKYDEQKYAEIIAEHLDIDLQIIRPQKKEFEQDLKEALKILKRPINSVSIVPWYRLMKAAKDKTMINGEGADELFGGYSRYLILKHIFELYDRTELINYKETLDFLFRDIHSKLVEKKMPLSWHIEPIMKAEYENTLPDILYMEEKLAEHFKVKLYQPFMSKNIKEFAQQLPMEFKIRGWVTKWILRNLASKLKLPEKVYRRIDKKGLVCPVNRWMNWTGKRGEFDKKEYLNYQKQILNENE